MKNKKWKWIVIFVVIFLVLAVIENYFASWSQLRSSYNLSLPQPNRRETVFRFNSAAGNIFEIWQYNSSRAERVRNHECFYAIEYSDINQIKQIFLQYTGPLNNQQRVLIDERVNLEKLIANGNYWCYRRRERGPFILLILEMESNKLFYFEYVWR